MKFTAIGNIFIQSFLTTPTDYNPYAVGNHFGLGTYSNNWIGFGGFINSLQDTAKNGTSFKVIFLSREGESWADVAAEKYGGVNGSEWESKWSRENGDGNITWLDAGLTETGLSQVSTASKAWSTEFALGNLSVPALFYSSPLQRSLQTFTTLFTASTISNSTTPNATVVPLVVEDLRATYGIYTPDERRPKSEIAAQFPDVKLEDGLTENDERWTNSTRETDRQHDERTGRFLEALYTQSNETYISIVTNPSTIASILRLSSHRPFPLQPGGLIPLILRGEPGDLFPPNKTATAGNATASDNTTTATSSNVTESQRTGGAMSSKVHILGSLVWTAGVAAIFAVAHA